MILKYLSRYSIYNLELDVMESSMQLNEEQQKFFNTIKDIVEITSELNINELESLENIVKHNNEIYKIFKNYQPKEFEEINIDFKKNIEEKIIVINKIDDIKSTEMIEVFTKISMILEVISYNKEMIKNFTIIDNDTNLIIDNFKNDLQKLENDIERDMQGKVFNNIDKYMILEVKSLVKLKEIFNNIYENILQINNEDFIINSKKQTMDIKKYL